MKNTIKASALFLAGMLALSACGSSGDPAEAASGGSASAEPASPSPTATLAVGQEQYTPDELEAALTAVKESEGLSGQIANDATVRPELKAATEAVQQIIITPEACSDLALGNLSEKMDNANLAIMQLSATDTVTILSYEDASFVEAQVKTNDQQMVDCKEFQMETTGQVFTSSSEEVEASTEAVTTQAYSVATTTAGEVTESLSISGFSGTTNITVAMQAPADPAESQARAEALIDAILGELGK